MTEIDRKQQRLGVSDISNILTNAERDACFELREDEDFVYLLRHGDNIAVFNAHSVSPDAIQSVIRKYVTYTYF